MALNADTLLDRLHLKAQITRWRLLAVLFAACALIALLNRGAIQSPMEGNFIARVTFDQIILDDQKIYDMLDEVETNSSAKAVIVWLDTPGGSAVAGEEIFLRLRKIAEHKPVVAVMRSVAASAGYMIALGADYIVAREGTVTGSIGVLMETVEITELADKLGVKPIVIKTDPLKAAPNPLEKSTPEAEQVIQTVIEDFHDRFIDMVAERRQLERPEVVKLSDGRVYSGKRAVDFKLVDAIGGEDEAQKWLETEKKIGKNLSIRDVEIKEKLGFLDQITQSTSKLFFKSKSIGLDGMAAIWHPQLY